MNSPPRREPGPMATGIMTKPQPETSLAGLRREMDEIDDAILDLLARRLAASRKVKSEKSTSGALARSPLRPAREAEILRRLAKRAHGAVPTDLMVRLWRVILSSSSLVQAPITIHLPQSHAADIALRLALRDHFGPMAVAEHRDEAAALSALAASGGDIAVIRPEAPWAEPFLAGRAGAATVMMVLPVIRSPLPALLVFGHAEAEATGDDETLVVAREPLPAAEVQAARWHTRSGAFHVAALPGFAATAAGLTLAGRYPAPLEARP
jgi:chorismate mutase